MGRLTGKYSAEEEPRFFGEGRKSYRYHGALPWAQIEEVLGACRAIAARKKASVAQVALNWCVAHGAIPIPGAKTPSQASDNCSALTWVLDDADLQKLDALALSHTPLTDGLHHRKGGKKGGKKGAPTGKGHQ